MLSMFALAHAEPASGPMPAPTLGAIVRPEVWYDPVRDVSNEDATEIHTWSRAWVNGELRNHDQYFLEARLQHHVMFGDDNEAWWEASLGESGWDGKLGGPFRFRVGNLIEKWGKLDLLPVADVINPRDARVGALVNPDFAHVPLPMGVLAITGGAFRAETVLIPFPSTDRLYTRETDWSYMRQGYTDQLLGEMTNPSIYEYEELTGGEADFGVVLDSSIQSMRTTLFDMSTQFRRNLDTTMTSDNLPEAFVANGEAAERLEWSGHNADLAIFGGYFRSRQPNAVLDPYLQNTLQTQTLPSSLEGVQDFQAATAGGPLVVDWPRTWITGLDGSALVGPVQLRLDGVFKSDQVVRRHWGNTSVVPSIATGVGVDWFQSTHFQLMLESRYTHLLEAPEDLMFSLEDQVQVAGGVRVVTLRDRLTMQLGGVLDATYLEGMMLPSVAFKASDHFQFDLKGMVISGKTEAPRTVDDIFQYEGGLLSYFQANDGIGVAVQYTP